MRSLNFDEIIGMIDNIVKENGPLNIIQNYEIINGDKLDDLLKKPLPDVSLLGDDYTNSDEDKIVDMFAKHMLFSCDRNLIYDNLTNAYSGLALYAQILPSALAECLDVGKLNYLYKNLDTKLTLSEFVSIVIPNIVPALNKVTQGLITKINELDLANRDEMLDNARIDVCGIAHRAGKEKAQADVSNLGVRFCNDNNMDEADITVAMFRDNLVNRIYKLEKGQNFMINFMIKDGDQKKRVSYVKVEPPENMDFEEFKKNIPVIVDTVVENYKELKEKYGRIFWSMFKTKAK